MNDYVRYGKIFCVTIAYDCIIDANDSWEKIIYYSMISPAIHEQQVRIIASVSIGIYGIIYGLSDVNIDFKKINNYDEIVQISTQLYKKLLVN